MVSQSKHRIMSVMNIHECERGFAVTKERERSYRRLFAIKNMFILLLVDFGNTTVQQDMGW